MSSKEERILKVSRDYKPESSTLKVGSVEIGPGKCALISGPCAVESETQIIRIANKVKQAGAQILRGGAFKPRTSPYTFQGLGRQALEFLKIAREETGLPFVTEAMDVREVGAVYEYADMIQVGSRNMQNYPLLKEVGKTDKPIMLKRGFAATIEEWLLAAEYIAEQGNDRILLCERGIRSFDNQTRNLLDLSSVPVVQRLSHLPIMVDPSHALGRRDLIEPMTLAAVAAGAQAIMIEVHDEPDKALSDGFQALTPEELERIVQKVKLISQPLDRHFASPSSPPL